MKYSPVRRRPTIGVILDNVAGESRTSLWPGIADTIRAHDGNLLCYVGGYLRDPHNFSTGSNVVYDLVDTSGLDGLIIWTSALSSYVGEASIRRFCDGFRPLPIVSIGLVLDGIPSIVLDSYRGMREVIEHLVTVHDRRRIVFIRGPEGHRDADERYRAYCDVLREHDLPLIPELVSPPFKWIDPAGRAMMDLLLDEQPAPFDAVASTHDAAAVEAMEILQVRGIRVPEDVSITGFDNTPLSKVVSPPLTTVPWRMYERGRQAATLMLSLLAGKPVPDQVLLRTHLVVRQSCGCLDPAVAAAEVAESDRHLEPERPVTVRNAEPVVVPAVQRDLCKSAIEQVIEEKGESAEWIGRFLDTFFAELGGRADQVFLPALNGILRQVTAVEGDISAWQGAVSVLRREILPLLPGEELIAGAGGESVAPGAGDDCRTGTPGARTCRVACPPAE